MAMVSVRYIVDDVDTAIEFYTKLTELAGVRNLIDDARAAVDCYTTTAASPSPPPPALSASPPGEPRPSWAS